MPRVSYQDVIEQTIESERKGDSLLEISLQAGLPHFHQCKGTARCTTCRVQILHGLENLPPRAGAEAQIATEKGWPETIRLACQTRPTGDVALARIVLEEQTAQMLFPDAEPAHSAEERPLAVMFCDLRNFTGFAAAHLPHDVVYVLNRFFREVCEPVLDNDGYIDKYLGDGFLAVFGLTKTDSAEFCLDALRAAARIPGRMRDFNAWLRDTFHVAFDFGIGLHYGPAVVGHTGHPLKMQLTVLGDTVNVASRAESRTKQIGTNILGTAAFMNHVRPAASEGRRHRLLLTGPDRWETLEEINTGTIRDEALLVQLGYDIIRPDSAAFAQAFYKRLFEIAPELTELFKATDMPALQKMFMEMIGRTVQRVHRANEIAPAIRELGARHATCYGVQPGHYPIAGQALIETLAEMLGDRFFPEMRQAWESVYDRITGLMSSTP